MSRDILELTLEQRVWSVLWYHESQAVTFVLWKFKEVWPNMLPPNEPSIQQLYQRFISLGTVHDCCRPLLDLKDGGTIQLYEEVCGPCDVDNDLAMTTFVDDLQFAETGKEQLESKPAQETVPVTSPAGVGITEKRRRGRPRKTKHETDTQDIKVENDKAPTTPTISVVSQSGRVRKSKIPYDPDAVPTHEIDIKVETPQDETDPQQETKADIENTFLIMKETTQDSQVILKAEFQMMPGMSTKKIWNCEVCGRKLGNKFSLRRHMLVHRDNLKGDLSCSKCGRHFIRRQALTSHQRGQCQKEPYVCPTCGKTVSGRIALLNHSKLHIAETPFPCNECDKKFKTKFSLHKHIKVTHSQDHVCSVCSRSFGCLSDLECHARVHTGNRPYLCDICGQSFTQSGNKNKHRARHSHHRPFPCSDCAQAFKSASELKRHRLYHHSDTRPFLCPVCNKHFKFKTDLEKHADIHSSVKKYKCSFCDKCYYQKRNLDYHVKVHHSATC